MRVSIVLDCADAERLVPFWELALAYRLVEQLDDYRILVAADGEPAGPVLILQPVPEAKAGKNRMHIDVHPAEPAKHISDLEALGGIRVGAPIAKFGVEWQTMADPEGNEFCVVAHGRLDHANPEEQAP
jgi:catechol 2,3-dioxygenase-like lactoylglutathione lyase family enzyme